MRTVSVTSWVEEWDPLSQRWVRISETETRDSPFPARVPNDVAQADSPIAARFAVPFAPPAVYPAAPEASAVAQYGPFVVLDDSRAAIVGSTDSASTRAFDAMLRDFPRLAVLEFIDAPGTSNDIANLAVGRRIRAAGLTTHVPRGGSVRSGAVELFLAGAHKVVDEGAQFAVHSWLDNYGREPDDFPADAPANRLYLDYYVEMGMTRERAENFYAMTNSVPHHSARWFGADEMRFWLRGEPPALPRPEMGEVQLVSAEPVAPASLARVFAIKALSSAPLSLPLIEFKVDVPLALGQAPRIAVQPMLPYAGHPSFALATSRDAA